MQFIQNDTSKGKQSVHRLLVLKTDDGKKVRIDIKSDSYNFQSHAWADVWNPATLSWNRVANIHFSDMKTPEGLAYKQDWKMDEHYADDVDYLLGLTVQILA